MFEFNWKFKDFEIRMAHTFAIGMMRMPYLELVKWDVTEGGRSYCYTLAYWHRDKDGEWELRFVGSRPFDQIAEVDISPIWEQLFLAQQMFMDAEEKEAGDGVG